ncbi:MAG: hypothetical protein A2V65_02975 [Deltaproteobacteria bacterium RBG_13_49_15]|nr:MAG: hypothetical protein A2V65_02975 [Deltaproteobacteria bacterium RBG_13_49_15]
MQLFFVFFTALSTPSCYNDNCKFIRYGFICQEHFYLIPIDLTGMLPVNPDLKGGLQKGYRLRLQSLSGQPDVREQDDARK